MNYSKEQIRALIKAIYNQVVNAWNLPPGLYNAIADHLKSGVYKGFGGNLKSFEYNSPDLEMLKQLRENIYFFSGAKTFNYVISTEELMFEGNELIPYNEFKKKATDLFELHNEHWLEAEYRTAIGQAQSARDELRITKEKNIFPLVEYVAVIDENTSQVCRQLDGLILPVNDPIWKTHSPLNHYQCRCLKRQIREGEISKKPKNLINPSPLFQNNPGDTGEVFNKHHPYFDVPGKYKAYAKRNFDLPVPEID